MTVIFTDRYGQERTGELLARHEDYAVPLNEVRTDDGWTAMLKDSEIRPVITIRTPVSEVDVEMQYSHTMRDGTRVYEVR